MPGRLHRMKPHILLKEVPHVDSQPIRQAQKRLPLLLGKLRLCHRRSSLNLVVCCRAFPFRPASAQRYKIPPKSPIDVFRDSGSQRNSPYAPLDRLIAGGPESTLSPGKLPAILPRLFDRFHMNPFAPDRLRHVAPSGRILAAASVAALLGRGPRLPQDRMRRSGCLRASPPSR